MLTDKLRAALLKAIEEMPEFQNMKPANGDPITEIKITDEGLGCSVEFKLTYPGIGFAGA